MTGVFPQMQGWVLLASGFLVVWQGLLSYRRGFLTRAQVEARGSWPALPFFWHGGMWGDLLLVGPAVAIIATYAAQWSWPWILGAALFGLTASITRHREYFRKESRSCHFDGRRLTAAGWIHFFYMAAVFAVALLFYLATSSVSVSNARWVTGLFVAHFFLAVFEPSWYLRRKISKDDWQLFEVFLILLVAGYCVVAFLRD